MDILIVGGGIAGLSLAAMLEDRDFNVRLVERAEQFDRVGYGIGLWRHGLAILEDLGLLDELRDRGSDIESWQIRRASGEVLNRLPIGSTDGLPNLVVAHRADLHETLQTPISDPILEMGTSIDELEADAEGVDATFTDGSTARFDLVVGADGIDSKVRSLAFDGWTVQPLETASFSLWFPEDGPGFDHPVEWIGRDGTAMLAAPVGDRTVANFNLAVDDQTTIDDPLSFFRRRTASLDWVIPEIVESVDEDAELFWTRDREVEATQWYSDRCVLVGDAAHALHPIVGVGATLALEDSRLLFEYLCDKAPDHVDEALRRYEARRKKRLRRFSRLSWVARKMLLTRSSILAGLRDFALARSSSLVELLVTDEDPVREPVEWG